MTFNDPGFIFLFLPLTIAGVALFGRFGRRSALAFLTFMSFVFYVQWNPKYLPILAGSILLNYAVSRCIIRSAARERAQYAWLVAGITANLAVLAYFKYFFPTLSFFVGRGILHSRFASVGLPLGISFFTFTQIAYLIDLKQGLAGRESLLNYSLFVSFFPHLVAGPIIHNREIMPQFRGSGRYRLDPADVSLGLTWFTMGLFKKVIIADPISGMANLIYGNPQAAGAQQAWLGVLAYMMQIYFDFSGYSDMAIGLARIFSIRFPINFDSPYKAGSVIEFWHRWHMTLTRYIMNYVFSPVLFAVTRRRQAAGKKVNKRARATLEGFVSIVAVPMLFTMLLVGLWHGAGLTFIAYGLVHGLYLIINHAWRTFVPKESRLRSAMTGPVAVAFTFFWLVLSSVFFRASGIGNAAAVFAALFGRHGAGHHWLMSEWIIALVLAVVVWLMPNTQQLLGERQKEDEPNWSLIRTTRWEPNLFWWAGTVVVFLVSAAYASSATTFVYFQF